MITKLIDRFDGHLTRINIGDMNSGLAKYSTTFGNDPFSSPQNLTWYETPIQIDSAATVVTDLILAGKEKVISGIAYVFCIGHTGRLYRIQVNKTTAFNPNFDTPILLTTLTVNSPTFTRGGFMDFFGTTDQIYIGHDMGVTAINYDGSGETFIGTLGSWTQLVPRPLKQFLGNLYAGNGNNFAQILPAGTVASYAQLSPSFPTATQVRDLRTSTNGLYLQATVTRLPLPDITSTVQDTSLLGNTDSYIFKWNGIDSGYTSSTSYPSFSLNANILFQNFQYIFGYDIAGGAIFDTTKKILSVLLCKMPLPPAVGSNGNLVGWMSPEYVFNSPSTGNLKGSLFLYGSLDNEVKTGFWRTFQMSATGTETDIITMPFQIFSSNFGIGSSTNNYAFNVFANGKEYFSTLETSTSTTKYKLYKFFNVSSRSNPSIQGIYETQQETSVKLFRNIIKKRIKVYEIRVFGQPWAAANGFQIDIIGAGGQPLPNGTKVWQTSDGTLTIGATLAKWNPDMDAGYSMGIRISNKGTNNHVIEKIEVDLDEVNA